MALEELEIHAQIGGPERRRNRRSDVGEGWRINGGSLIHDPTRSTLTRLSSAAITDSAVTRPVPGFSALGTFSMVISKRTLSPTASPLRRAASSVSNTSSGASSRGTPRA